MISGVPMMAPPDRYHQKISGELFVQLREYLKGKKCEVYSAPFAVRLKDAQSSVLEDGHYAAKEFGTARDQMKACVLDLSLIFSE